jgi:hypothetical protein
VPSFNLEQYIVSKRNLEAENPEEADEDGPFGKYMKELDIEDSIMTSKTFSV